MKTEKHFPFLKTGRAKTEVLAPLQSIVHIMASTSFIYLPRLSIAIFDMDCKHYFYFFLKKEGSHSVRVDKNVF